MAIDPRPVHINQDARDWTFKRPFSSNPDVIQAFHEQLPGYEPTPLLNLPRLAEDLGFGQVFVKDESNRLNLPSFKILGASWGTYRAVVTASGLPIEASFEEVKAAVARNPRCLVAATDGNHGRAVARMAGMLGVRARIYTAGGLTASTLDSIRDEGAEVIDTGKSYDDSIFEAEAGAVDCNGLLIQDTAFEGYIEVPQWIVDGYSTMMKEIDNQLDSPPDLIIVPVGVGSLAQAVVSHSRQPGRHTSVMAVEPDTSSCLFTSLRQGQSVSIKTSPTISAGLDCGTVSTIAWPILRAGIRASLTVSDQETHEAVLALQKEGVNTGPCGSSGFAGLRRLTEKNKADLGLGRGSTVVLLSTEGYRPYDVAVEKPKAC